MLVDSVLGKRVLMYWENRGMSDYRHMKVFIVAMDNIFLQRVESHLSENAI